MMMLSACYLSALLLFGLGPKLDRTGLIALQRSIAVYLQCKIERVIRYLWNHDMGSVY